MSCRQSKLSCTSMAVVIRNVSALKYPITHLTLARGTPVGLRRMKHSRSVGTQNRYNNTVIVIASCQFLPYISPQNQRSVIPNWFNKMYLNITLLSTNEVTFISITSDLYITGKQRCLLHVMYIKGSK